MRTVAVIPVKGRLPLLKHTIRRLLEKNKVSVVICVGELECERHTIEQAGGVFLYHKNNPLGAKWNYGFYYAKQYNPDAILFVGSSDWVSDNWLDVTLPIIQSGADMVGTRDFTMLDIGEELRVCKWIGYHPNSGRYDEPIGIGRVLSRKFMDKIEWTPFVYDKNNSMDYSMMNKLKLIGGESVIISSSEQDIISLSISTNKWDNMHKFQDHWDNKVPHLSVRIEGQTKQDVLNRFPESKDFYADLYQ